MHLQQRRLAEHDCPDNSFQSRHHPTTGTSTTSQLLPHWAHSLSLPPLNSRANGDFPITSWLSLASWLLAIGFFNIICVYACYGTLICAFTHLGRRLKAKNLTIKIGENLIKNAFILAFIIGTNLVIYWPYIQTLQTFGKRPGAEILTNLPNH